HRFLARPPSRRRAVALTGRGVPSDASASPSPRARAPRTLSSPCPARGGTPAVPAGPAPLVRPANVGPGFVVDARARTPLSPRPAWNDPRPLPRRGAPARKRGALDSNTMEAVLTRRAARVVRLGRIGYEPALALQREAADAVRAGGPETLFLLEHEP